MKVWGKEFRRLEEKNFELYLVDDIKSYDEFVQILNKNSWGFVPRLGKIIHTDGSILVVSRREVTECDYVEVKYLLQAANWFLVYEKDRIQLFVKSKYEGNVHTKNKEINSFLNKYYSKCRDVIISKKQFAREMSKIASKLNLPFDLVMAFRGDENTIEIFIDTVKKAVERCLYLDSENMQKLISKSHDSRQAALEFMKIYVPREYMGNSLRIGQYVYNCLESIKVIKYKEY